MRPAQFRDGYASASRWAISRPHRHAEEVDDAHAGRILDSAGHDPGHPLARRCELMTGEVIPPPAMDRHRTRLILGSASPRRLDLLAQIGVEPHAVRPADIDEMPRKAELPRAYVVRMAREKAEALAVERGEVVLAADTTVAVGRRILGKPEDEAQARAFLALMSGRRHKVLTAVALRAPDRLWERCVVTTLKMRRLEPREVDAYLATGDWRGKAGGYGIQGPAAALIPWMEGSYTAVVGLPLAETAGLLRAARVIA